MRTIYKIKKISRGWIVVNTETGQHSHFKSEYGCGCIIFFINNHIIPDNNYLKESYRRLTEPKKVYKEMYINVNKGVTKCM